MAQVTVTELAKTVGASLERLLTQMKEAGLPHVLLMKRFQTMKSKLFLPI